MSSQRDFLCLGSIFLLSRVVRQLLSEPRVSAELLQGNALERSAIQRVATGGTTGLGNPRRENGIHGKEGPDDEMQENPRQCRDAHK